MTKLSGVRHGKREFEAYSLALSLAHRTRAQPDSRQAAAVVCWRSSRSNPAAASCELALVDFAPARRPYVRRLAEHVRASK